MTIVSMTATSIRFRVPSTFAAGQYKLALDGSVRPAVTRCDGPKSCDLVNDSAELASLLVTVP